MSSTSPVTITPLGGLGEIGMNCMTVASDDHMIVVDCGLMFPDDYMLGIDVVIPRFDHILENKDRLRGIVLTHGHEDHIGALPWLLPYVDVPVYGSTFTLALVEGKLREHNLDRFVELREVAAGDRIELGDIAVNFFPVCHSIIQGFGLGIETPAGRLVHTGDFKIDPNPLHGNSTDLDSFREFSREGALLLLSDSTNVEREGHAPNEREIMSALSEIFRDAKGRIIITLFSSHIQRMQEVFDLAWQTGRKVAVSGRSIMANIETARRLGFLSIAEGVYVDMDQLVDLPDEECVLLVTGSQGEPLSALTRIASGEHRQLKIQKGDMVILSSRFIPGNVRAITRVINNLYRLGAEVLYERIASIHASGHAFKEELRLMLETVRPKFFVPVHGEYRHLVKHSRLAQACGVARERTMVLEDGQPITFQPEGGIRFEESTPVDKIYVDGKGVGDVGATVIKERQLLGGEGLVIVFMVVDGEGWEILVGPNVESKGFVFEQHYSHLLDDAKCIVLDIFEAIPPGEETKLKERIRSSLRRFFRKILERDPVVVPLVVVI
ncbi:ribonuclease J [Oceanidesulfovibrio marinus]|uniref:Ribonuclease J n=1 Tax=Oceanidesulfovibrio marinus TaxID=370038 RepID=A0ABX6NHR6_9BACT|nr:ribonuclease J [Oceanidesulfovibrio marinus]QJT09160.1 ribonuclease J [Oceanidesulfovibrio marinus]